MPPSTPLIPNALPPIEIKLATKFLFINPVKTATTISRLTLSVTRRPLLNLGLKPCLAIHLVTRLPPPCITTTLTPFF